MRTSTLLFVVGGLGLYIIELSYCLRAAWLLRTPGASSTPSVSASLKGAFSASAVASRSRLLRSPLPPTSAQFKMLGRNQFGSKLARLSKQRWSWKGMIGCRFPGQCSTAGVASVASLRRCPFHTDSGIAWSGSILACSLKASPPRRTAPSEAWSQTAETRWWSPGATTRSMPHVSRWLGWSLTRLTLPHRRRCHRRRRRRPTCFTCGRLLTSRGLAIGRRSWLRCVVYRSPRRWRIRPLRATAAAATIATRGGCATRDHPL